MKKMLYVAMTIFIVVVMLAIMAGCGGTNGKWFGQDEEITLTAFEKLFVNGPIPAMNDEDLWGYINSTGDWVIEPQFEITPSVFDADGFARIQDTDEFYGYIDLNGDIVIAPQYRYAGSFSDGLARVAFADGYYGFINEKGETVIEDGFIELSEFHEGLAAAEVLLGQQEGSAFGFIDKQGNWVITPAYTAVTHFSDGVAFVHVPHENISDSTNTIRMINTKGETLADFYGNVEIYEAYVYGRSTYITTAQWSEGLCIITNKDTGLSGYVDMSGNLVVDFKYSDAFSFTKGGLACVKDSESGLYGYIDTSGKSIIDFKFSFALSFTDHGLACVKDRENGLFGYINTSGEYVIQPQYLLALNFNSLGYAVVTVEGEIVMITSGIQKNKLIDTEGNEYGDSFPSSLPFCLDEYGNELFFVHDITAYHYMASPEGIYPVVHNKDDGMSDWEWGYIDATGNLVIDCNLGWAGLFSADGSYAFVQDGISSKYGIINNKGEWLIPPNYKQIVGAL